MSVKTQILLGKEVRTLVVNRKHQFVNMNDLHKIAIELYGCKKKPCVPSAYLQSLQAKAAVKKLNDAGCTSHLIVKTPKLGNVCNTYCHKEIAALYVTWMCKELKRHFEFFSKLHLNDVNKVEDESEKVISKKVTEDQAMKAVAVLTAYIGQNKK